MAPFGAKRAFAKAGSVAVAAARWEHPDIVMVPALLALADVVPISGRQFIAAYVVGDEINALGKQRAAALMSRIDKLGSIVSMRDFWKF